MGHAKHKGMGGQSRKPPDVGNSAAKLKRQMSHTKLTAHQPPPPRMQHHRQCFGGVAPRALQCGIQTIPSCTASQRTGGALGGRLNGTMRSARCHCPGKVHLRMCGRSPNSTALMSRPRGPTATTPPPACPGTSAVVVRPSIRSAFASASPQSPPTVTMIWPWSLHSLRRNTFDPLQRRGPPPPQGFA